MSGKKKQCLEGPKRNDDMETRLLSCPFTGAEIASLLASPSDDLKSIQKRTQSTSKITQQNPNMSKSDILHVNRMIPVPDVTNSTPEHLAFVSSSVSMAATEVRLIFLEMGT